MEKRKKPRRRLPDGGLPARLPDLGLCKPDDAVSVSERRKLAQKPELTLSSVLRGEFMTKFETYTLDQFPLRDSFRRLKAVTLLDVLQEKDNNGIYLADSYAAKLDASIDEASVQYAADRFQLVYDRYLAGTDAKVYVAVIPDKNAFLARQNGYPAYDPADLSALLAQSMPYASMIDLTPRCRWTAITIPTCTGGRKRCCRSPGRWPKPSA